MLVNLGLVVLQSSICHRANRAGLLLGEVRVGRREVSAHGTNDRAGGIRDRLLGVGVLEGRASGGVLAGLRDSRVVVDDGVVVVLDLGVGDGAAGLGVAGVVVRVVGREDGGGGSHNGADLLGGRHGCGGGGGDVGE